jgi:jumonji domain-containing protein 7
VIALFTYSIPILLAVHRDHYENVYLVVSGSKTFTLIPPTDVPWVPYSTFPPAKFTYLPNGEFAIQEIPGAEPVPWIPVDPLNPDYEKYPDFANARVLTCQVNAGEALYLPSLWLHHVRQSHGAVALNFWYDMEFDLKYVYYKFVEGLCQRIKSENEEGSGEC